MTLRSHVISKCSTMFGRWNVSGWVHIARRYSSLTGSVVHLGETRGTQLQKSTPPSGGEGFPVLSIPLPAHTGALPHDWTPATSLLSKPSAIIRYRETTLVEGRENEKWKLELSHRHPFLIPTSKVGLKMHGNAHC